MLKIRGTYFNGQLQLDKPVNLKKPVKVLVTFEEHGSAQNLKISDFSFIQSQEILKEYKGSFSDEVIEDRRIDL